MTSRQDELDRAHRIRHDGIACEARGCLVEAEKCYDEALALYRKYSTVDDLNYANAVRYVAVIKERLGKHAEATSLWNEAVERYRRVGIEDGVAESVEHLAQLAEQKD
jgi:tetratricopeptide (TPR) repeat protein